MIKRLAKSRFARDAGLLQISGIFGAGGALLSSVLLSHILGPKIQGNYLLALAGFGLCFMLLGTGVPQATISQVAAARAREQWDKVAAWLAFAFKAQIALGLLLCALGPVVVVPIVEWITNDHQIGVMAWWLCLTPIFEAPKTMSVCALQGARRMRALALLEIKLETLRLVCMLTAVLISRTAHAAIVGSLCASALGGIIALVAHRREARGDDAYLPSVGAVLARVRGVPLRQGLPLGMRLGILRSTDALGLNVLPSLILKYVSESRGLADGSDWVAYFRIAQRLMQIPVVLLQGLSRTALPSLSALASAREPERFRKLFLRVSAVGGAFVAIGLAVAYPIMLVVVRIYDPNYHDPVSSLAGILAIGLAVTGFAGALDSFYLATGRLRVAIIISVVGLFVTMPILAWFVERDPHLGVAWGMVVVFGWILIHYVYIGFYFARGLHRSDLSAEGTA